MKTTVNIRDDIFRRAKAKAALLGQSLSRFMESALEKSLQANEPDASSWKSWAMKLPAISREAAKDLNAVFEAPDFPAASTTSRSR